MKPFTEDRPWGNFRQFTHNEPSTVKIITVKAGEAFSLQYHNHRTEFWHILSGDPQVTCGEKVIRAKPGDEFLIEPKMHHRVAAGKTDTVFLEVAFGDFNETGDIIRLEDNYGRA
jgi:mannose-6-phosphate isomerase-like protein (cupin superfamily)